MQGKNPPKHRTKSSGQRGRKQLKAINPNAAGIDCGASSHYVAVNGAADDEPVRRFASFTHELHALAGCLAQWRDRCIYSRQRAPAGVQTVAMESTGNCNTACIAPHRLPSPLYDLLEERGFKVVLVNARAVNHVPGRNEA